MHIIGDVIKEIKKFENCSQNLIFTDPPYNLGSTWFINQDGQPEVKIKSDFMNKWNGLTCDDLKSMFNDFFRILKHGGYCVFAGQARQVMAFQYYAINAEFEIIEPIYSYNISNFPKSLDVSKALDKHFGEEREIVGKRNNGVGSDSKSEIYQMNNGNSKMSKDINITIPASELVKKYDGIKSSICPLKQTTEIWNIFRKPFKYGTIVKDILAYEDGDETIHPSGLNIDGGRIPCEPIIRNNKKDPFSSEISWRDGIKNCKGKYIENNLGRYPSQLFLDGLINYKREDINLKDKDFLSFLRIDPDCIKYMSEDKALEYVCNHLDKFDVSKLLDEQSEISKSQGGGEFKSPCWTESTDDKKKKDYGDKTEFGDIAGCSRILHKASFVLEELYQHIYYSKPSRHERNAGCIDMEKNHFSHDGREKHTETPYQRHNSMAENTHPTLKSLKLLYLIIQLFKTPDHEKQKILIPFSGVSSEKIAFLAHGYKGENITSIEISEEYSKIGQAREKFWKEHNYFFKDKKEEYNKNKESIKNNDNETGRLF